MSSRFHPDNERSINASGNHSIVDLIESRKVTRRAFLKGSMSASVLAAFGGTLGVSVSAQAAPGASVGFSPVRANTVPMTDAVTVPAGYSARVLIAWGDSLGAQPHWDPATPMTEAIQLGAFGAHVDGMHYFPLPHAGAHGAANRRGLLVTNHEYTDPGLVHGTSSYAADTMTLARARAQQAGHGVSVAEIDSHKGAFEVKRTSPCNRRITGNTPCAISGPAAGHAMLRTAADPAGITVLGTLNNCAHGHTPWGTYLACEENWNGYFGTSASAGERPMTPHENRYGVSRAGSGVRWHEVDARFDIRANPNETNRFGWVVEIDPYDAASTPVKRTALGRFKHESAGVVVGRDNKVAVYMGDDERNEYVYKFVAARRFDARHPKANRGLLDEGALYVAKFAADGSGTWLPLTWNQNGLTPANGFADQGEVLIKCRQAADRLGATMMDRPEWVAIHPETREVYLTLTNNNRRGGSSANSADGTTTAGSARPPVDAANARADNLYGHIIRWRESGDDVAATTFAWDIFAECGDKLDAQANHRGSINGDDYGAPDGLWFDKDGRLWIQTDQAGNAQGDWVNIGGNVMMCANPATGETRRFLTSPPHCEVTGVITTPDGRTMFIGIQHPGEDWSSGFTQNSSWPDNGLNGPTTASPNAVKPRSAVVVITKDDGGVIGT